MYVKLTRVTNNPVMAIEEAASNCYNSTPSKDGRIMNSCYKSGHKSVLEFANFTFHIEGVSRALLAQLTRYRHASFAVESQRYVKKQNIDWVVPYSIKNNKKALSVFNNFHNTVENTYNQLLQLGIPLEDARFVLTNACPTALEVTMNLSELIHFMNQRLCKRAQWEIRELARKMKEEVLKLYPENLYPQIYSKLNRMLVPQCEIHSPYCFCVEHKSCGKHPKLKEVYETFLNKSLS